MAPIESNDERRVATKLALEGEVATINIVDVDKIVVRANTEHGVVGRECHALDPLGRVSQELAFGIHITLSTDGDLAVITGDSKPFVVASDSAGALGRSQVRES